MNSRRELEKGVKKIAVISITFLIVSVGFTGLIEKNVVASISSGIDIMVFAPHPDDEALGAGGAIYKAINSGRSVKVVIMTNGDAFQGACEAYFGKWGEETYDRQQDVIDSPIFSRGVRLSDSLLTPGGAYYQLVLPDNVNYLSLKIHHFESGIFNNGLNIYVWNWQKSPQDWDYIGTTGNNGYEVWISGFIDINQYVDEYGTVAVCVGADGWDCSDIEWVRVDCNKESSLTNTYYTELGKARIQESINAMSSIGLSENDIIFLGYPDAGLNDIWTTYQTIDNLYTSPFTDVDNSPYDNSYTLNAQYCRESVLNDIKTILNDYNPDQVYIPHFADTHFDHSTTNKFVTRALREIGMLHIDLYEYLIHWDHQDPWPEPQYENTLENLNDNLRKPSESWTYSDPINLILDTTTAQKKYDAINTYISQVNVGDKYLLSFARKNELLWESEIEGPPMAIKAPPSIQIEEKSKPYFVDIEIENRYSDPVTTKLSVTESSEGLMISHKTLSYDIEPFETQPFLYSYENEWSWVDSYRLSNIFKLGVDELETAAGISISKNSPLYHWLLEKDVLFDHRTRNMKLASKTLTVAGIALNGIEIIMAWNELNSIDSEKLYTYTFENEYTDNSGNTFYNGIENVPSSVDILLRVPIAKHDQLVDLLWARIIAAIISIAVAVLGLIFTLGIATLLTSVAEGIFAVVSFILEDILIHDPPDHNYDVIPDPDDYYPSYPTLPSPTNRLSRAFNNVIYESSNLLCNLKAMLVSYERYQGAIIDDEPYWTSVQFDAMNDFSLQVSNYIIRTDEHMEIIVEELDSIGYSITEAAFNSFKNDISGGLPPLEEDIILQYGYSPDDFRNILLDMNYDYVSDFHILSDFDKLAPMIPIEIAGEQGGVSIPEIIPPTANSGGSYTGYEGSPIQFDASHSSAPGGEILSYEWDFNSDGSPDAYGIAPTYTWYDNIQTTITLKITVSYTVSITDKTGETTTINIIIESTSTSSVKVFNLDPTASIDTGVMYIDLTLRGAGEKFHNIFIDIYETDEAGETDGIGDGGVVEYGEIIAHLEIERSPGSPDDQSDTVYDIPIYADKIYFAIATYYPYEDDKPINGQVWGSNPIWLIMNFEDGNTEKIHHNFNVRQSLFRDSDHWVHREPWPLDFSPYLVSKTWTFEGSTTDQGTDDETFTWDWGDASPYDVEFYPFRGPGSSADPFPSPYDQNEGNYPVAITDTQYHAYQWEDDFICELTLEDDDFPAEGGLENDGMSMDDFDVDAIHTRIITLPDGTVLARK